MPGYQGEQITVRVPKGMRAKLREAARTEGIVESVLIRETLEKALRKRQATAGTDPMVEAMHTVLPRYFRQLHDLVASARYDAVIAREMAQAAALAAVIATDKTTEEARMIVRNTMS